MADDQFIKDIQLEEQVRIRRSPQVEHELKVALFDLREGNSFEPDGDFAGPYNVLIGIEEDRLFFDIKDVVDQPLTRFTLSMKRLRSVIKEYFLICDSYYKAIKSASPSKIETIDMGRRGLHNQGAELLQAALLGKATIDENTAKRLFTIVCILHIRA